MCRFSPWGAGPTMPRGSSAEQFADRLEALLKGARMGYGRAGAALELPHVNSLRYGTTTGRILMRWEGALQPTVWTVPAPAMSARDARLELARRYLHVFAPATAASFAKWAGIADRSAE